MLVGKSDRIKPDGFRIFQEFLCRLFTPMTKLWTNATPSIWFCCILSLVFSTFPIRIQQKNSTIVEAWRYTEKISTGKKLGEDKDKMHQNEIEGALIFVTFFGRIFVIKLWQNKKGRNSFEMPTKNDVFFSAGSCKKDIIFGGHLFSFLALLIYLGL